MEERINIGEMICECSVERKASTLIEAVASVLFLL